MSDNKFERCAEDDPLRCQGIITGKTGGQCPFKSVEGGTYCPMHGGIVQQNNMRRKKLMNYQLQQYQERVGDLSNSPEIKSLREEIGILRMTLENVLNLAQTPNQLLTYSDKITHMVGQLQKLVEATQRIEERNNALLDRKVVIVIADSIVTLLGNYINDPDQLTEIGSKICESIAVAASPENSGRVTAKIDNSTQPVGM